MMVDTNISDDLDWIESERNHIYSTDKFCRGAVWFSLINAVFWTWSVASDLSSYGIWNIFLLWIFLSAILASSIALYFSRRSSFIRLARRSISTWFFVAYKLDELTFRREGEYEVFQTPSGGEFWTLDGYLHRADGPAAIEKDFKFWFWNNVQLNPSSLVPTELQRVIAEQDPMFFVRLKRIDPDLAEEYSHLIDLSEVGVI